jgi:hypothetical protein
MSRKFKFKFQNRKGVKASEWDMSFSLKTIFSRWKKHLLVIFIYFNFKIKKYKKKKKKFKNWMSLKAIAQQLAE